MVLKAAVFDLDGVITKTSEIHFEAWKILFDALIKVNKSEGGEFTSDDYERYVNGIPRVKGVEMFMNSRKMNLPQLGDPNDPPWDMKSDITGSNTTIWAIGNAKNDLFNKVLHEKGVVVYEGTVQIIKDLLSMGVHIGVASSSKNCRPVLKKAGIDNLFESIVDGVDSEKLGLKGKPNPDLFLTCLQKLGGGKLHPSESILVEDAQMGVQAGRAGNFELVIGIDRGNNHEALEKGGAHKVIQDFSEITIDQLKDWFSQQSQTPSKSIDAQM